VIVSGDLGRHGIAVLSVREGLEFEGEVASDCAPLWQPVEALLQAGIDVHCLRDLTRGGLSSALNEIAASSGAGIQIVEQEIPVSESIRGACEILGLDPMYVANEGRFVAFVPGAQAAETIAILRRFEVSSQASIAGEVNDRHPGLVSLETALGAHRVLEMLSGEQLPRIC
jgi:hydrogenase expression/formation protein HypE